jgi:site-specific DNA-adenine methylase
LIGCYQALRDDVEAVIKALGRLEREHRKSGDACYYDVRDRRFNPRRAAKASGVPAAREALVASYSPDLAAMLIFLNRTGFNGLLRLNRQGGFNVPAGRYAEPRICDPDHLRAVAEAFGQSGLTLELAGFETTIGEAGPGDFIRRTRRSAAPPASPTTRPRALDRRTRNG